MILHRGFPIRHGFVMEAAHSKDTPARQSLISTTLDPKLRIRKRELYWPLVRVRHLGVLQLRNELCTNYSLTHAGEVLVSVIDSATKHTKMIGWHFHVHSQ